MYSVSHAPNMGVHHLATSAVPSEAASIVCIVDDDISVRESLGDLIKTAGWDARTFASAREFIAFSLPRCPACLVLDVSLPGLNGLELQDRVADELGDVPVIFITGYGDIPTTVRAMKAGAVEFLTKPVDADALLRAIKGALERSRVQLAQSSELERLRDRYGTLTPREREVMTLVAAGLLNKQVGWELGISEITVKAHRGRVMGKMKAKSFAELVMMHSRLGHPGRNTPN